MRLPLCIDYQVGCITFGMPRRVKDFYIPKYLILRYLHATLLVRGLLRTHRVPLRWLIPRIDIAEIIIQEYDFLYDRYVTILDPKLLNTTLYH